MNINELKKLIKDSLDDLYDKDNYLIINDLGERCIVHRFALYLENRFLNNQGYYIDCEYNKAYSDNGGIETKKVISENGNAIDIVATKRNNNPEDDLFCFEIKKWNNNDSEGARRDKDKLMVLTGLMLPINFETRATISNGIFRYKFGIFLVVAAQKNDVKLDIYKQGFRDPEEVTYSDL